MTLRELILSVDSEQYADSPLYQRLRETKPKYGSNRRIEVKLIDGRISVLNAHVGSLADIVTYAIDIAPELNITKVLGRTKRQSRAQLLDAILNEIASGGYDDSEQTDFWNDFDNLQKAKIIR
jgi:hypothetical protein